LNDDVALLLNFGIKTIFPSFKIQNLKLKIILNPNRYGGNNMSIELEQTIKELFIKLEQLRGYL